MLGSRYLAGASALAASLAAGCGGGALTGPSALAGGSWTLRTLQLADFSVLTVDGGFTVEFSDGRLAAQVDCNRCTASYQVSGDTLSIGPLACTRAFCGPDSLHDRYIRILQEVSSHGVRDGTLTLRSAGGVLRYARR